MELDDLGWLCTQLALPVFEETAQGAVVRADAPTNAPLFGTSLLAEVTAQLKLQEAPSGLEAALQAAREGSRTVLAGSARGPRYKLFVSPAAAGRARVVIAPISMAPNTGLVDVAAAVSHEVANAVGSIRGWADLALHKSDATVDVDDALTLIRSAARSAEQAARSMLTLARGEVDAGEESCDFSEFAAELLQLLTLTARERRVTLESSVEPLQRVRASRAQLFTITFNLVKNAIEACSPGGLVSVRVESREGAVRLSVRDTGEGLDAAAQARLFDRYYTTKPSGTGLGLPLVRDAVQAIGGELTLDSQKGRGTLFQVVVPHASEPSTRSEEREMVDGAQPLHARVLVVDDDHGLRELLATALTLRGAEVVSVRSADEAHKLAEPFDIALIDMMLEGCRGDELLSGLRQRGLVQAAMLVTGTVQKPRLVPGGEPDDWVRKPFEIPQLVDRIRRTLERHRMLHDASSAARL